MATVSLKNEYRFSARIDTPRRDEFIKTRASRRLSLRSFVRSQGVRQGMIKVGSIDTTNLSSCDLENVKLTEYTETTV